MNLNQKIKNNKKWKIFTKKDCCVQSLKQVNCFLSDFSNIKKALTIFKWFK